MTSNSVVNWQFKLTFKAYIKEARNVTLFKSLEFYLQSQLLKLNFHTMYNKWSLIVTILLVLIFKLSFANQPKQCPKKDAQKAMQMPVPIPDSCKKLADKSLEYGMGHVYKWYEHYFDGCVATKVSFDHFLPPS